MSLPVYEPRPLDSRVQPLQLVENITTKESPSRLHLIDEEMHENHFTQFGAACRDLPSSVSHRLTYRCIHRKNLAE